MVSQPPDLNGPCAETFSYVEFEILGEISNIEKIAVKTSIRDLPRLRKMYGKGRWRKLKGTAHI
jgi:hypothetical protein